VSPEPTSSAPEAEPVPRFVGPADDGRAFTMTVDQTTTLRMTDAGADDPVVDGGAVLVIAVANVSGGDAREWEIRAVEPGEATVQGSTTEGDWSIVFVVSG
jgi:hypothetical protein